MARFRFLFTTPYRLAAVPFGVTPRTAMVEVDGGALVVRFGPWRLRTRLDNVVGCETTGPFSFSKTAGPAHLSVADRGLTCATNGQRGLCIRFDEPVPCIDPWGRIRHPAVTVTVERIDQLRRLLDPTTGESRKRRVERDARGVAAQAPMDHVSRWLRRPEAIVRATWQYLRSLPHVSRSYRTTTEPGPRLDDPTGIAELQPMTQGTGPVLERTYRALITDTRLTPEQLTDRIAHSLERTSTTGVFEFVAQRTTTGAAEEGSEYRIRMPGPWDPAVRVIGRTPTSIRLATLAGHMEAGQIELHAHRSDNAVDGHRLTFEIRSVARTANHSFSILYNRLRLAREMQLNMWVEFCHNVCDLAEGHFDGKIQLSTVEHRT